MKIERYPKHKQAGEHVLYLVFSTLCDSLSQFIYSPFWFLIVKGHIYKYEEQENKQHCSHILG